MSGRLTPGLLLILSYLLNMKASLQFPSNRTQKTCLLSKIENGKKCKLSSCSWLPFDHLEQWYKWFQIRTPGILIFFPFGNSKSGWEFRLTLFKAFIELDTSIDTNFHLCPVTIWELISCARPSGSASVGGLTFPCAGPKLAQQQRRDIAGR